MTKELLSGLPPDDPRRAFEHFEASLPDAPRRQFKPWHKPRKQLVRVSQWGRLIKDLIKTNGTAEKTLRYFGLPGEDFLDIRSLEWACPSGVQIRFLGFDETADLGPGVVEANISQNEVSSLPFVDKFSKVCRYKIEHLASEESTATKQVREFGPYDVINLDFCRSVGGIGSKAYFQALSGLCDLQTKSSTRPWLLFLTTRAGREHLENETKALLLQCIVSNINSSALFASNLKDQIGLDHSAVLGEITNKTQLSHSTLVKTFGLAVGKWLLKLMITPNPKVSVKLMESYWYRVKAAEPDMLSLAFLLEPLIQTRSDGTGLTPSVGISTTPDETQLAGQLINPIAGILDADQILEKDEKLRLEMIDQSGGLLAQARYSKSEYETWVKDDGSTSIQSA